MAIFDKGANSKENLDLIEECGHDYLTAMKHNKSLDKHINEFWNEGPVCMLVSSLLQTSREHRIRTAHLSSIGI